MRNGIAERNQRSHPPSRAHPPVRLAVNRQLELRRLARLEPDVVEHSIARQVGWNGVAHDARTPHVAVQPLVAELQHVTVHARHQHCAAARPLHTAHLEQVHEIGFHLEHERESHRHSAVVVQPQVVVARLAP